MPQKSGVLCLSSLGPADFYLGKWVSGSNELEEQTLTLPPPSRSGTNHRSLKALRIPQRDTLPTFTRGFPAPVTETFVSVDFPRNEPGFRES